MKHSNGLITALVVSSLSLAGCVPSRTTPAPVVSLSTETMTVAQNATQFSEPKVVAAKPATAVKYTAPVRSSASLISKNSPTYVKVQRGDSLYKIAHRYGLNYHQIADNNHLRAPYVIYPGQKIWLKGAAPVSQIHTKKVYKPKIVANKVMADVRGTVANQWQWPAKGKIIKRFTGKT